MQIRTNLKVIRHNKQYSLGCFLRECLFAFLILWLINPQTKFSSVYNWNIYGVALIAWIIIAFVVDQKSFVSAIKDDWMPLVWLWPTYLMITSWFGHAPFALKQYTTPFIFVFFCYYVKTKKSWFFKTVLLSIAVYFIVVTVNTYIVNTATHEVSRILAHGDFEETYYLSSPFIANFPYCYSITGVAIALIGVFRFKNNKRIVRLICIALYLWLLVVLVSVEYVLAIIGVVILSVWILITPQSANAKGISKTRFLVFMVSLIVIVIVSVNLSTILQMIYDNATGNNIKLRLSQLIAQLNQGGSFSSYHRYELYATSLKTWVGGIDNFFFGVGYYVDESVIGQHSTAFDTLGRYGIVGGGCFIATIIPSMKHILKSMSGVAKYIQKIVFIIFVYEAIVNPVYVDLLIAFYFCVIPLFLTELTQKDEYGVKSDKLVYATNNE